MLFRSRKKPSSVLTKDQAIEIFRLSLTHSSKEKRPTAVSVARAFNVSEKTVRDIWSARTWHNETLPLDVNRIPRAAKKIGRPHGRFDSKPRKPRTVARFAQANAATWPRPAAWSSAFCTIKQRTWPLRFGASSSGGSSVCGGAGGAQLDIQPSICALTPHEPAALPAISCASASKPPSHLRRTASILAASQRILAGSSPARTMPPAPLPARPDPAPTAPADLHPAPAALAGRGDRPVPARL